MGAIVNDGANAGDRCGRVAPPAARGVHLRDQLPPASFAWICCAHVAAVYALILA